MIEFVVPGRPISQPRPRVTARGSYMPKHYVAWLEQVKDAAQIAAAELDDRGEPWNAHAEAYRVRLRFFMPDLRRTDVDKLAASILDALKGAGLYGDDSLVDELNVKRARQAPDRANPRVEIRVQVIGAAAEQGDPFAGVPTLEDDIAERGDDGLTNREFARAWNKVSKEEAAAE